MAGPTGYGSGSYGAGWWGGGWPPFGVSDALALSPTMVRVRFNSLLDMSAATTDPANYVLAPSVAVHGVLIETAGSVLLLTDPLNSPVYVVTVSNVRMWAGRLIDPALRTASFLGFSVTSGFSPVAVSATKVRLLFGEIMQADAAYIDPSSYSLIDSDGVPIPIVEVIQEGPSEAPRAVALVLGSLMDQTKVYTVIVSSVVQTASGHPLSPDRKDFHWTPRAESLALPNIQFSGEVTGGLFGQPAGQVFFSPALEAPAGSSTIQVDYVTTCTQAFDKYEYPQPKDPRVLFTHGAGLYPTPVVSTLSPPATFVLMGRFDRVMEASLDLSDSHQDTAPQAVSSNCRAVLQETWDPSRVSLLNSVAWHLYDGIGSPFITADNLAPIPPGATTSYVLEPP